MTERDDIESLFSSAFEGAEMLPPPAAKEAIDKALFSTEAAAGRKKGWLWWSLAVFLLIGGGSYWMLATSSPQTNQAVSGDQKDKNNSPENGSSEQLNQGLSETTSNTTNSSLNVQHDGISAAENGNSSGTRNATNRGQVVDDEPPLVDGDKREYLTTTGTGDGKVTQGGARVQKVEYVENGLSSEEEGNSGDEQVVGSIHPQENGFNATKNAVDALATAPSTNLPTNNGVWMPGTPSPISRAIKSNPWSLAAYAGTAFGFSTLRGNSDMKIEEQAGIYGSFEAIYSLRPQISISGGFDFAQRKDRLIMNTTVEDSVFTGNTIVYVYDTSQVIVDTLYYPNYQPSTSIQESVGYVRYYSIGVPIYLRYRVAIGQRFSMDAAVGVRFSYQKYRNEEIAANVLYPDTYKQFGVNISFRPEFTYQLNRLGVGIYGRIEYDVLNGMQWNALTRKRWSAGLGLCVRYKL